MKEFTILGSLRVAGRVFERYRGEGRGLSVEVGNTVVGLSERLGMRRKTASAGFDFRASYSDMKGMVLQVIRPLFIAAFASLAVFAGAHAENSIVASAYNQIRQGQYCSDVRKEDISTSGLNCSLETTKKLAKLNGSAADLMEHLVFERAADAQVTKNKCLQEQIETMMKDPKRMQAYKFLLVQAWLNRRKANLMWDTCNKTFYQKMDLAMMKREGFEKEWARVEARARGTQHEILGPSKEFMDKWKPICLKEETATALRNADELFSYALPVISAPAIFDAMDKNRDLLKIHATGKPITDQEILATDLRNLESLRFDLKEPGQLKLDAALQDTFKDLAAERAKVANRLSRRDPPRTKAARLGGSGQGPLESDHRDYLFEEGTVHQVMLNEGMMYDKATGNLSNSAACLLARYEPTLMGSVLDFSAKTIVTGGAIGVGIRGVNAVRGATAVAGTKKALTAGQELKRGARLGAMTAGVEMLAHQVYRHCFSSTARTRHMNSMKDSDASVSMSIANLPEEITTDRSYSVFSKAEAPSCEDAGKQSLLTNSAHDANCMRELLFTVLPMKAVLPAMLLAN
jgi:hypothetical protein